MTDLDALRAAHPELGFAIYAMEPGGVVTFEIYTENGVFAWKDTTVAGVLAQAFPPDDEPQPEPEPGLFD